MEDNVILSNGTVTVKDLNRIPQSIWEKVFRTMKSRGYDYYNADDTKSLYMRAVKQPGQPVSFSGDQASALTQAMGLSQVPTPNPQMPRNIMELAKKGLGVTTNFSEAGYILPDGSLLDLSGKKDGGRGGDRALDHRMINSHLGDNWNTGTRGMSDFVSQGGIRIDYAAGSIQIGNKPTSAQLRTLRALISSLARERREIYLDIQDGMKWDIRTDTPGYERRENKQYNIGTNPAYVLTDIEDFFSPVVAWVSRNCRFLCG